MMPFTKVRPTLIKKRGGGTACLEGCCRVSSDHQLPSKLEMEWAPLLDLLSLLLPNLAEY